MTDEDKPLFVEVSDEEWEAAKPSAAQTVSRWDKYLDQVAAGKKLGRDYTDNREKMQGDRISIGRRAKQRNISLDLRSTPTVLYMSLKPAEEPAATSPSGEADSQPQPKPSARGKKRKPSDEEQALPSEAYADQIPMDESSIEG